MKMIDPAVSVAFFQAGKRAIDARMSAMAPTAASI